MSEEIGHIHLGAGCLGLGLVVSSSCRAGLDVHVVVAQGRSLPRSREFELEIVAAPDKVATVERHTVAGFWHASSVGQLPEAPRDMLLRRPHLLITTALKTDGFEESQPFILELVEARSSAGATRSTTFIAAENDAGPSWHDFREALEARGVRVCQTMVNRYCPSRRDENGCRRVKVDQEEDWVIELTRLPIPPPLAVLATLPHVKIVDDSERFEKRKLWLVNGSHLALAILARSTRNIQRMNVAAAEPGRTRWVLSLQHELAVVLRQMQLAVGDEEMYGLSHFESVLRHEDEVGRILRRLKRDDLVPFVEDFRLKLGEAMRWQMTARGELSRTLAEVLDELQKLLLNFDSFEDAADIREGRVWMSGAHDEASLAAYESMIGDLLHPEHVRERMRVLRHVWKRQRERFERRTGQDRRITDRRKSDAPTRDPERRSGHDRRSGIERRGAARGS